MADQPDDLLNPDEIEALLQSSGAASGSAPAAATPPAAPAASSGATNELLDPSEIEKLLQQRDAGGASSASPPPRPTVAAASSSTERLLDQAEADLAKAIGTGFNSSRGVPSDLGQPGSYQFASFDSATTATGALVGLPALQDVELDLRIELGRTELLIDEVLKLKEGSVVPLDKLAGDPVDILVNGRLIARGEVLVLNDNFCVRVAEILTPDF